MKLIFTAVLTIFTVGTAMSASILHKEIEIGHNGVRYKVVVDAEKQHGTTHNLAGLEEDISDEHEEHGKTGIHFEVPDAEHLHHHHDEEEKHYGVVIHIDLGGGHDSEEEESNEHHDLLHHYVEHHGLKHQREHALHSNHDIDHEENHDVKHQVHLELSHHDLDHQEPSLYNSKYHQKLSYEDLEHILKHQEDPSHHEYQGQAHAYALKHHDSGENELEYNKLNVPHQVIDHPYQDAHQDLEHYGLGSQEWVDHGQKQNNILGQQKVWHLFPSRVVKPIKLHHGVPIVQQEGHINEQPLVHFGGLHHHVNIHH